MERLTSRAGRGVVLAALSVACVLLGPTPPLVEALERVYAVAIWDRDGRRRGRDRVGGASPPRSGPGNRRPAPTGP